MRKIYLIRKNVAQDRISHLIDYINRHKNGIYKVVYYDETTSETTGLPTLKSLMEQCKVSILFVGTDPSSSKFLDEEIQLVHRLGLKRSVFTLDKDLYHPGSIKGIPKAWRNHCNRILSPTISNVIREIHGGWEGVVRYYVFTF
ncbi:MAG: hypothetical protein ACFFFG_16555 [Candidatus Thorarchaeota archaeon]